MAFDQISEKSNPPRNNEHLSVCVCVCVCVCVFGWWGAGNVHILSTIFTATGTVHEGFDNYIGTVHKET